MRWRVVGACVVWAAGALWVQPAHAEREADAAVETLAGNVVDAFALTGSGADDGVWLSVTSAAGRARRLVKAGTAGAVSRAVPARAVFVDGCAGSGIVFADGRGLVDAAGKRLLSGAALFSIADPEQLLVAELCSHARSLNGELRLLANDGLWVARGTDVNLLALPIVARAFSGRVLRGLRPDKGYAVAASLFAPKLADVDIDGDGDLDLCAVREAALTCFERGADGLLNKSPRVTRDLLRDTGAPADADLRVRFADVAFDPRPEIVVGVTVGAIPDSSTLVMLSSAPLPAAARANDGSADFDAAPPADARTPEAAPFSRVKRIWRRDGLVIPLGVSHRSLVLASIDTSLVSISGAVLTGRLDLGISREAASAAAPSERALTLHAKADVRGGRVDGVLPIVSVDVDSDGIVDLVDFGEPAQAAIYRGTDDGFSATADLVLRIPPVHHVVPLPEAHAVLVVGAAENGSVRTALVRYP